MTTLIGENFYHRFTEFYKKMTNDPEHVKTGQYIVLDPDFMQRDTRTKRVTISELDSDSTVLRSVNFDKKKKSYVDLTTNETTTVYFVFYPFFDSEGTSHLIYSKRTPDDNKNMTVYHESKFRTEAEEFHRRLHDSFLDRSSKDVKIRLKIVYKKFVLDEKPKDAATNQMDPNYALLLNYIFEQVSHKPKTEKTLMNTIRDEFRTHNKEYFKSQGQTLTYDPIHPDGDDLSNVIGGTKLLTNTTILAAYATIPNHSQISLLSTEGNEMFRKVNDGNVVSLKAQIRMTQPNPKGMYFIVSNYSGEAKKKGYHWALFVIKTKPTLRFEIYDSIQQTKVSKYVDEEFLVQEMNDAFQLKPLFTSKDIVIKKMSKEELQKDVYNCGVFTLLQMQRILNDTETVFDVLVLPSQTTLKATLASFRMDILFKIWYSGNWEASQAFNDRLPQLFAGIFIAMDAHMNVMNQSKEQAVSLYQALLDDENPTNKFQLLNLYETFQKQFGNSQKEDRESLKMVLGKTDSKTEIKSMTDRLTSGLTTSGKDQLRLSLLHLRQNTQNMVNEIIKQRRDKLDVIFMQRLMKITAKEAKDLFLNENAFATTSDWLKQLGANEKKRILNEINKQRTDTVDVKFMQQLMNITAKEAKDLLSKENAFATTSDWLEQFDANKRKRIFNSLFPGNIKSEAKKMEAIIVVSEDDAGTEEVSDNEGDKEVKEYDDLTKAINKLLEIVSNRKYKCDPECILRIADKLFVDFADSFPKPITDKVKSFSIKNFLTRATSSSSNLSKDLQKEINTWTLEQKSALQMGLERVNSILE